MGVEFILASHADKTFVELGKGPWGQLEWEPHEHLSERAVSLILGKWKVYPPEWALHKLCCLWDCYHTDNRESWVIAISANILLYCSFRSWEVEIFSDTRDSYFDIEEKYRKVADRYEWVKHLEMSPQETGGNHGS